MAIHCYTLLYIITDFTLCHVMLPYSTDVYSVTLLQALIMLHLCCMSFCYTNKHITPRIHLSVTILVGCNKRNITHTVPCNNPFIVNWSYLFGTQFGTQSAYLLQANCTLSRSLLHYLERVHCTIYCTWNALACQGVIWWLS